MTIYDIDYDRPIVIREQTLNKILTEEYGVEFCLQQWAFYDGEPVANYTLWEMTITDDLNEIEYSDDVYYWDEEGFSSQEEYASHKIIEWQSDSVNNKDIAYRPSLEERIDPQILLWKMCKEGKILALGEVKVYVNW